MRSHRISLARQPPLVSKRAGLQQVKFILVTLFDTTFAREPNRHGTVHRATVWPNASYDPFSESLNASSRNSTPPPQRPRRQPSHTSNKRWLSWKSLIAWVTTTAKGTAHVASVSAENNRNPTPWRDNNVVLFATTTGNPKELGKRPRKRPNKTRVRAM